MPQNNKNDIYKKYILFTELIKIKKFLQKLIKIIKFNRLIFVRKKGYNEKEN